MPIDPMTATAESKKNTETTTEKKPETGRVVNPQYEDQGKKEEESPLDKVKAGLSVTNDVSVDPASVKPATFKASIDLASINEAIIGMSQLVDNAQDFMFRTIKPELMDPSELASAMNNPNLKEYAQQVYEVEKQKFDSSQAMGRNIALSLIGQVFSSASGVPGKVATTGMDTFKAGADTIQANMDAVNAQNRLVDEANQKATEAMNKNMLEYVKDYNKYETDIVKAKNQMIYKTYENNVKTIKDLLGKKAGLDKELIKGATQGMKEREANKRKEQEINADISIANLDAQTKIAVKNLDSRTKIAIANQVDRIFRYKIAVDAERLDRDERNSKMLLVKDAYKDTAAMLSAINVNPVKILNSMNELDPDRLSTWADIDAVSSTGFLSALESRVKPGFFDPNLKARGIRVGADWDTDGAALINFGSTLVDGGWTVDGQAWSAISSELTNDELNSIRLGDNGKIIATGKSSDVIKDLEKKGLMKQYKFKDRADKQTRSTQWMLSIGTNIKYNLLGKTDTAGVE